MKYLYISLLVLFVNCNVDKKEVFNSKIEYINEIKSRNYYNMLIMTYFKEHFECPEKLSDLEYLLKDAPGFQYSYSILTDIDPFSKDQEKLVYIPLYNQINKKREAFFIFSSGIDGKINNSICINDTFYINDIEKDFNFYNTVYPTNVCLYEDTSSHFSYIEYLFGRKDYLVEYFNCKDFFVFQVNNQYSSPYLLDDFIFYLNSNKSYKAVIGLNCPRSTLLSSNNDSIYLHYEEYSIKCAVQKEYFVDNNTDTIKIIGNFDYSKETKEIIFKKSIIEM